jgi:hypothetical protein
MKEKSIISLVVLVLLLVSCRQEPASIFGTWEVKPVEEIEMYWCMAFAINSHGKLYMEWWEVRDGGKVSKQWGKKTGKFDLYNNMLDIEIDGEDARTYKVDQLTSDELVLSSKGGTLKYHKVK